MKWDAGSLSKHRNKSPIFRYLSNNPPRNTVWPKGYLDEFGIFCHTPGVTQLWVAQNFNMTMDRVENAKTATKHLAHLGLEIAYSATHDDAVMYSTHRPLRGELPFWVKPFIVEDLKQGLGWRPTKRKWHIGDGTLISLRNGRVDDVLYTSNKPRWGKNLDNKF
jgi:hypothetical protein